MRSIEEIIRSTTEENQEKLDWTKAWSRKYPILASYQKEVDCNRYAKQLRVMLDEIENEYHYSKQDAMLVLKDILAHEYLDQKGKNNG